MRQRDDPSDPSDPCALVLDRPVEPARALPLLVVAGAVTATAEEMGEGFRARFEAAIRQADELAGHPVPAPSSGTGGARGPAVGPVDAAPAHHVGGGVAPRASPAPGKAPVVAEEVRELQDRFNEQWPEQVRTVTDIETSIARLGCRASGTDGPTDAADVVGTDRPPAGLALHDGSGPVQHDGVRTWPMELLGMLAESWDRLLNGFEGELGIDPDPEYDPGYDDDHADEEGARRVLTLVHPTPSGREEE